MNAHDATATHYCKFGECTNEVNSAVGRYSYCEKHRDRAARGLTVAPSRSGKQETLAARIAGLATAARKVDAAKAKARKLAEQALAAKRHADELEAAFAASLREATNGASPDVPAPTR